MTGSMAKKRHSGTGGLREKFYDNKIISKAYFHKPTCLGSDGYLSDFNNLFEEVRLCTVIETPKNFFPQTKKYP